MEQRLAEMLREQRTVVAALKATASRLKTLAEAQRIEPTSCTRPLLLLRMVEGLIDAHKAAKIDDDGHTLDLIEDALRHVGKRLEVERPAGRRA